jgi:hypothetical protein
VSERWYYEHGGRTCGPVSADQLRGLARCGGLAPEDLIWAEEIGRDAAIPAEAALAFPSSPPPDPLADLDLPAPLAPSAGSAPDWLGDLADAQGEAGGPPAAPNAAPLDWLADVRRAEQRGGPPGEGGREEAP